MLPSSFFHTILLPFPGICAQTPPPICAAAVKVSTAWEWARCIVLESASDLHGREPTDVHRVGKCAEGAVRWSLELRFEPILKSQEALYRRLYQADLRVHQPARLRSSTCTQKASGNAPTAKPIGRL